MRWPYRRIHTHACFRRSLIGRRFPPNKVHDSQVAGPGCRTFWFRCKVQAQMSDNTGKTPLSVRSPLPDSSRTAPSRNRVHYCAPPSQASGKVRLFLPAHDMRSAERSKSRVVGAEWWVVGGSIRRGTGSQRLVFSGLIGTPNSQLPRMPLLLTSSHCHQHLWRRVLHSYVASRPSPIGSCPSSIASW